MKKKKSGIGVIAFIIFISIFFVVGFILGVILSNYYKDNLEDKKITDIKTKEETEEQEKIKPTFFDQKEVTLTLKANKQIIFNQFYMGDDRSIGYGINAEIVNAYFDSNIDTGDYGTIKSIGAIEKDDNIFIIALMSNLSNKTKVYYELISRDYLNNNINNNDLISEYIINNFKLLETNLEVDSIGKIQNNGIIYPVIASNDTNYIIDDNGLVQELK